MATGQRGPEFRATTDTYRHIDFLRVTEEAALAASKWVGKGKKDEADDSACGAMRTALNSMAIKAKIVIGEGERDEAPMLYIGEKVGAGHGPKIDIACDPLEGTTITALGRSGVPVYVLHRPGREPLLLPEVLSKQVVFDALATI